MQSQYFSCSLFKDQQKIAYSPVRGAMASGPFECRIFLIYHTLKGVMCENYVMGTISG